MKRILFIITVLALVVLVQPDATSAQEINLLQNANFTDEIYHQVTADPQAPEVVFNTPNHWGGGVVTTPASEPWRNVYPTGFPHTGWIKLSGDRSFHIARGGGTFTAWIYQQVSVQPETPLLGGVWGFVEGSTGLYRVGIDPLGGTNPFEDRVVWSAWSGARGQWSAVNVGAMAEGSVATLFIFATQDLPSDPNGVYFDNAFLTGTPGTGVIGAPPPPTESSVEANLRLNVRSGPGISFNRIGGIAPGTLYPLLGEEDGWYRISYDGQTGYVSAQFATMRGEAPTAGSTVAPAPAGEPVATYTVRANLRLRSGPGANFDHIGDVPWGDTVGIVGRSSNNQWLQVIFEGQTGWVINEYGSISGELNTAPVTG